MRLKAHLMLRRVGGKYMIIDPSTGVVDLTYVYTLNETAAWLWDHLKDADFTFETIAYLLKSNYGLSCQDAHRDTTLFLSHLMANHLLEQANGE